MAIGYKNSIIRSSAAVLVFITLAGPCCATGQDRAPLPLPPSLHYDGKPIPPYCFSFNPYSEERLEYFPADCDLDEGLLIREAEVTQGEIYVSYDSTEFGGFAGYDGYSYLGGYNNIDYINHYWSGGGSGQFSEVFGLSREQNRFKIIDHFVGGDRCNGGYLSAEISKAGILSSVSITPYDLISLPYGAEDSPYANYDEIDVCASCCIGRLTMMEDVIVSFELNKDYSNYSYDSGSEKSKQFCLDQLVSAHLDSNQSVFNKVDLDVFVKDIEDNCLKAAKNEQYLKITD